MCEGEKRSFEYSELLDHNNISRYEEGKQNIREIRDDAITDEFPSSSSLSENVEECHKSPPNEADSDSDPDKDRES